jgi:hypothetical protein
VTTSDDDVRGEEELLFSGDPTIPPPEVIEEARRQQPAWFRILEAAYTQIARRPENAGQYADPAGKGATILQISRVFELFGAAPFCVLTRTLPAKQTDGIARLVQRSAAELVEALRRIQARVGELNVPTLHHDGKTGHCIRLVSHDAGADTFLYHDPWPARSLLAEENNRAGVRAQPSGTRWTVTGAELERVLVACFVFPHLWLRAEGADFELKHDAFRRGDFHGFFHLKEVAEQYLDDGGSRFWYAPGPFRKWLRIGVDVAGGRVVGARLHADRSWMAENVDMALDLVKSFVVALAPEPASEDVYREIGAALWILLERDAAERVRKADPEASLVVRCVHVVAGSAERAYVSTDLASLTMENTADELSVEYKLL